MRAYHVTTSDAAASILSTGFEGGWGDVGFGVYFWATLDRARAYAAKGGWDGSLENPVILEAFSGEIRHIHEHEIHEGWDADLYRSMVLFKEMDEDDVDAVWRPDSMGLAEGEDISLPSPS